MDHRDWTVGAVDRPEKRQSDCVITSEGNDSGQGLSILCWTFLFRIRRWSAAQDGVVSFFNLVKSPGIVIPARQFSICTIADADSRTYDVTGMSPQSRTVAQLLNGFVSNGTLYPPLKPTLREPVFTNRISAYMLVGETD